MQRVSHLEDRLDNILSHQDPTHQINEPASGQQVVFADQGSKSGGDRPSKSGRIVTRSTQLPIIESSSANAPEIVYDDALHGSSDESFQESDSSYHGSEMSIQSEPDEPSSSSSSSSDSSVNSTSSSSSNSSADKKSKKKKKKKKNKGKRKESTSSNLFPRTPGNFKNNSNFWPTPFPMSTSTSAGPINLMSGAGPNSTLRVAAPPKIEVVYQAS